MLEKYIEIPIDWLSKNKEELIEAVIAQEKIEEEVRKKEKDFRYQEYLKLKKEFE